MEATPSIEMVAAAKRIVAISCVGFALACTPAAQTTNVPVEAALSVPPIADGGVGTTSGGVRFGRVPATVGSRWTVSTRAESRADDDQSSGYESDYTVEVLAVSAGAPSRVRLRFDRNMNVFRDAASATIIHGNTYVVDATAPNVRDSSDAAVSERETERVLDAYPDIGMRSRIDEVLPDDAMAIGERRNVLADAILRTMHPRAWKMVTSEATLSRVTADDAVFTIVIVADSQTSGIHLDTKGEAKIRLRDSRLVALELEGSYTEGETKGAFTLRRVVRDE